MTSQEQAIQSVLQTFEGFTSNPNLVRGLIGDGAGNVEVADGAPYQVYVRRRDAGLATGTISPDKALCIVPEVPLIDGVPVVMESGSDGVLRVLGRDDSLYVTWLMDWVLRQHQTQHQFSNYDTLWVQKQQFLPFLMYPSDPEDLYVRVMPEFYPWDSGVNRFDGGTSPDLSGNVPALGGQARFVLISIDGATNLIQITEGPLFSQFIPPTTYLDQLPTFPTGAVIVGAVLLRSGTAAVGWDELWDIRFLVGTMGGSVAPAIHGFLDAAAHDKTQTHDPVDGDVIVANAANKWTKMSAGSPHQLFKLDAAGKPEWDSFNWDELAAAAAADVTHDHSAAAEGGAVPASSVEVTEIGAATYDDVQDWMCNVQSSMYITGCGITENVALNGTIDITEGYGYIKSDDEDVDALLSFDIAAEAAIALAAGINYIFIDYNGGAPVFADQTTPPNHYTEMVLGKVFKDVHGHVHILQGGQQFSNFPDRVLQMLEGVFGMQRASGIIASEGVTNRALLVTAGVSFQGVSKYTIPAFDGDEEHDITGAGVGGTIPANDTIIFDSLEGDITVHFKHGHHIRIMSSSNGNDGPWTVESASWDGANTTIVLEENTLNIGNDTGHVHDETFVYWYYNGVGGAWVEVNGNVQIDNENYDDITLVGLAALTPNRYGVHWVFSDYDGHVNVLYGQGNYTLSQAEAAVLPGSLPDHLSEFSELIAKVIIKKSAANFLSIVNAWDTPFFQADVGEHNDLAGLQGGAADDYYHLTQAQHAFASAMDQSVAIAASPTFANITIGGNVTLNGAAASIIIVDDNEANALTLVDAGATEYVRIVSTDAQPEVAFNHLEADIDFRVASSGLPDAFFVRGEDGFVGVGDETPLGHFTVEDAAVNTILQYYGIHSSHEKKLGATDQTDDFYGFWNETTMDQVGGVIGYLSGIWNETILDAGTVGAGAVDVEGFYNLVTLSGGDADHDVLGGTEEVALVTGTVAGDVYGRRIIIDIDGGFTSIGDDVFGLHIDIDDDLGATGDVYMLYLKEQTGVDWGIYQDGAADNYFGGKVGIGRDTPSGHLDVYDATVDTTAIYYGIYSYHIKTAGVTTEADDLYGFFNQLKVDHVATIVGHVRGIYNLTSLDVGTVGDGQEDLIGIVNYTWMESAAAIAGRNVMGLWNVIDIDAGEIAGDVYGTYTNVDIEAAVTTLTGDVYGHYIKVDADKDPTGSVYMLYLEELSGVDYGIYQNGGALNVFGGDLQVADLGWIGRGAAAPRLTFLVGIGQNAEFNDCTWVGIEALLYHIGDENTNFSFEPDKLTFTAGNIPFFTLAQVDAGQDYFEFNENDTDMDFIVNTIVANSLFVRGSDGFIGVQTAAPTGILSVYHNAADADILLWVKNDDPSATGVAAVIRQDGSGDILQLKDAGDVVFVVLDGGNVGINVADPDAALEVNSAAYAIVHLHELDSGGGLIRFTNTTETGGWYAGITGSEEFGISMNADPHAGAEFIIEQSGDIGIGTAAPLSKLDIYQSGDAMTHGLTLERAGAYRGTMFLDAVSGALCINRGEAAGIGLSIAYGGNVGIGTTPTSGAHLSIRDSTLSTTVSWQGLNLNHKKTAGVTTEADDLNAIYNYFEVDHTGSTVGHVRGIYNEVKLTDGTIGDGSEDLLSIYSKLLMSAGTVNDSAYGMTLIVDLDGGTIANGVIGMNVFMDIESAMASIGGDIMGCKIYIDADENPTGDVYMLYIQEGSGINYGIYQNGTADNYFGGDVGIGTDAPGAELEIGGATTPVIWITDSGDTGWDGVSFRDSAGEVARIESLSSAFVGERQGDLEIRSVAGAVTLQPIGGLVGIGVRNAQGVLHGHQTIGGFMYWEYDGLNATRREVIPNGAGDVTQKLNMVGYVVRRSDDWTVSHTKGGIDGVLEPGSGAVEISNDLAGNTTSIEVNADGSVEVWRSADDGSNYTYKVVIWLLWI